MPRRMLDTNICIHAIRQNSLEVVRRLAELNPANTVISSIVAAELWTGVMKSRQRRQSEQALKTFLSFVEVLDWPVSAAQDYGQIRTALEAKGKLIGPMDLLIAAHALSERFTLVTRNIDEFARVEGLKLESWADRPLGH
jgi:tRNA(fMet)-specific endonuclease VapC